MKETRLTSAEAYRPGLARDRALVAQLRELQQNPRSLVFASLAESYRAQGLPHQALEILEEGLAVHPGLASALLIQARCLFDLKRFAEASNVCREVLAQNPENIRAAKLQAEIFVRLGQRRAAMRALDRVLVLFPQDEEARAALRELRSLDEALSPGAPSPSTPPALLPPGRIRDFQVGSVQETLANVPDAGLLEPPAPAAPASANPFLPEEESAGEPAFATRTIAELYLRQGLKSRARRVLLKMLQEEPGHSWARETLQDLGSDGIVLPAHKPRINPRRAALSAQAKTLERLLAHVRLAKARSGNA